MKVGLAMFPTEYSIQPAELASMAEDRGFESLFFPEHTHIPASRRSPYPMGGDLPEEYWHSYDPFVALTAAAAATETLKVATGICLIVQRDPLITAKSVASLDRLSGGRFLFGVGAGWNEEEMAHHGTDPRRRFGLMRERVEAMKEIWTTDEPAYDGEHVSFEASWSWPKPLQEPHPPVLVGGNGRTVLDRVLAYGDEWYPNKVGDDDKLRERMTELRRRGEEEGRGPLPVTLQVAPESAEEIEPYAQVGVHRCVYYLPSKPRDEVEARLDQLTQLAEEVGRA